MSLEYGKPYLWTSAAEVEHGILVKMRGKVIHVIRNKELFWALQKIPLFRLYIDMLKRSSPFIQATPHYVTVELPGDLFSRNEYYLLYHLGNFSPKQTFTVQLDKLVHAAEYLGFSSADMNFTLTGLLWFDNMKIIKHNRIEGLYIAYYLAGMRLFVREALFTFGAHWVTLPEKQPSFREFKQLVNDMMGSRCPYKDLLNARK